MEHDRSSQNESPIRLVSTPTPQSHTSTPMTHSDEAQYLGRAFEEVPKVGPDRECNGKTATTTEDGERLFDGYCSLRAGWGVIDGGEDGRRCKLHGGVPSGGAPPGNQNALTHGLIADPHHYYRSLSPEHKQFIDEVSTVIIERVQKRTGSVDYMDRLLARQIAIEIHIHSRAVDYIANESGLSQDVGPREQAAPLLEEVRQYGNSII